MCVSYCVTADSVPGPAVLLPAPHDPTPDGDEDLVRQGLAPPAPVPTAIPFGNDGSSPAVTLLAPREPTPDVDEDLIRQGLAAPAPGPTVVVIDTVQEVPDEEISQEEQQEEMVKKLEDGMSGPETAEVATDLEGEVTDSESVASQSSGLARTSTTQVPMPAIMPATPSRLTQRRVGAEHPPQDTACQADEDPDDNAIRSMPGAYPREPSSFKWEDAVMILGFVVATVLLLELFAKQGVRICLDWLDQFFLSMGRLGGRWAQKLEQGFEEGFDRNGDDGKSYDAEIDIIDFYLWGNGYKA